MGYRIVMVSVGVVAFVTTAIMLRSDQPKLGTIVASGDDSDTQWLLLRDETLPRIGYVVRGLDASDAKSKVQDETRIYGSSAKGRQLYISGAHVLAPREGLILHILDASRANGWQSKYYKESELLKHVGSSGYLLNPNAFFTDALGDSSGPVDGATN